MAETETETEGTPVKGNGNGRAARLLPPPLRRPGKPGSNGSGGSARVVEGAKDAPADLLAWLDERTLFAFVVQAVTGVFLAMYYTPSTIEAYDSITNLTNNVFMGEFVRGMHKWGASVMVILVFVHMARTFFVGAYKYPRELNWIIGVVLLILTMVMGFTGYLLPFDQRSYWATIVGVNINGTGPIVGPFLSDFLRAGPEFSQTTLSRFYSIHMMMVPGAIIALIGAHLYLVVKQGTTAPPWVRADTKPKSSRAEKV
jgi:menaquinol-cytochrome c reductase cytochrome b subunit